MARTEDGRLMLPTGDEGNERTGMKKSQGLDDVRSALVDAASVGAALWIPFLLLLFYLGIAAGGVTHRDLFLENPVKLPFLSIDLPLVEFFTLAPIIFIIMHAYMLLQMVLLAGKIGAFHRALRREVADHVTRDDIRRQLPNNILVQFLAGPSTARSGVLGFLLRAIAWITLVFAPLLLLLFVQIKFLPYHDLKVTWLNRAAIAIDIGLLWALWPSVLRGSDRLSRPRLREHWRWALGSVFLLWFSLLVAVVPGEWTFLRISWIPTQLPPRSNALRDWRQWWSEDFTSAEEFLFEGTVDDVRGTASSPFSNRLILPPDSDFIDHSRLDSATKLAVLPRALSLRGRDLRGAILTGAILPRADFTGAQLDGAILNRAIMREATIGCGETAAECASFRETQLKNADLKAAVIRGADFGRADLSNAQLQGADIVALDLIEPGSADIEPSFRGTRLIGAQLLGARISHADMRAANLTRAQLQGVLIEQSDLRGTALDNAELDGAELNEVKLNGSVLLETDLRGAKLNLKAVRGAAFDKTLVWRAEGLPEHRTSDILWNVKPDQEQWAKPKYQSLTKRVKAELQSPERIATVLARFDALNPDAETGRVGAPAADRSTIEGDGRFSKIFGEELRNASCEIDGPGDPSAGDADVIRALGRRSLRYLQSPDRKDYMQAVVDPARCPPALYLTQADRAALTRMLARGPQVN
jgi:uncharacterized protein YjbI with pentapeptide repeats